MANAIWEYAWEFFYPSYHSPGGATLTQSPTAPAQQPFVDGTVTDPPPRNTPTISPAFGKLDSESYFAYTPGYTYVVAGKDRIINWRYRYLYHGESGFGTCGGGGDYTYGEAALTPMLLAVPDVMKAPSGHLAGWQSMSLRVAADYDGNGGTWGDKNGTTCDTDDSMRPGDAQMTLQQNGTPVLDRDGVPAANVLPEDSFDAHLGVIRPPAVWPPYQLHVTHTLNTIIVMITVVAYVRVESAEDPPEPPPPANNIPQPPPSGSITPSGTPSSVATGLGGNSVLRPPC